MPAESSLATKAPVPVSAVVPTVATPSEKTLTYTLPALSVARSMPVSIPGPPMAMAHCHAPVALSLATYTSSPPRFGSTVVPNVRAPSDFPST